MIRIIPTPYKIRLVPDGRGIDLPAALVDERGLDGIEHADLAYSGGRLYLLVVTDLGSLDRPDRHRLRAVGLSKRRRISCRKWLREKIPRATGNIPVFDDGPPVEDRAVLLCAEVPEEMRP